MIDARFSRTISVQTITGTTADEFGNPVPVETSTDVVGHWRQLSADELGPDAVGQTAYRLHLPAGTSIDAGTRVDLDGTVAEVIGNPQELYNPRTGTVIAIAARAEVAA